MNHQQWLRWTLGRGAELAYSFESHGSRAEVFDLSNIPGLSGKIQAAAVAVMRGLKRDLDGDPEIQVRLLFKPTGDLRIVPSVTTIFPATKSKYDVPSVYAFRENGELKICNVSQRDLFREQEKRANG